MPIEVKKYDPSGKELAIRFGLGGIKAVGVGMVQDMIENRQENNGFKDIYDFASNAGLKAVNKKSLEALAKSGAFDNIHPSRNQIVESVEIICKYASAQDEEKNSNQMSLFASSKIVEEKPALKKVEEFDKA
ncbi:MAG: DNA polymerase-3 subunit alpha, partial [Rickettsiales bacterium]